MQNAIIECVPNISEGRDSAKIKAIAEVVETVEGVRLLDIDPGKATHRTVITFVGSPEVVVEAAFRLIAKAAELIDMRQHRGEHPRFGATDVCPLIPISGISIEETAMWAHKLGERVGRELGIPGYYYESAAKSAQRKNLADCREGQYEGLPEKLIHPEWTPDFGPAEFNDRVKTTGAVAIAARDFLVAYNVNLNTTSTRRANAIAFDIREAGRTKREGDPVTGKIVTDAKGEPVRIPGKLKAVKGIGWFIEEYGIAQISYNLTNLNITPIHIAFEESCKSAQQRGMRVTGSELVGLVPLQAMLDAGTYFLHKQQRSSGVSEAELIKIAVKSLGLDDLAPFDPQEKIIEYKMRNKGIPLLADKTLREFANETASESPAPGGGSVSAYMGAMAASLGTMVANLSAHKRGWDSQWKEFSDQADKGQKIKDKLMFLVDEDTRAFARIMDAFALPKDNESQKIARRTAIDAATLYAAQIPLQTMEAAIETFDLLEQMIHTGNPNSITDAGVGVLAARAAVLGARMNVRINAGSLADGEEKALILQRADRMMQMALQREKDLTAEVEEHLK
jgi:glutamate formiminotransferase/formiminotetrahydrofolate cyclodeaminase